MEKPIAFLTYLYLDNVFDKVTPTHKNLSMKKDLITFKELSIQMYYFFNKKLSWIKQLFLESKSYHRSRKNDKTDFMAIFLIVVAFYRLPRGC